MLTLKNWDRNTKKADYKAIARWLRKTSKIMEADVSEQLTELMIYGSTVVGDNDN